jgi:hypothetical protein
MNATILAERTAKAIAAVEAETRRLGGQLTLPSTRGDTAHRHLFMLEAIGAALAGIGGEPAGPHEVEAVEAIITVVAEPEVPAEPDAGQAAVADSVTEAPPASTGRKTRK